jgi:acetate kinase
MNILVINSGSSSIKYQLFKMPSTKPVCTGLLERIGQNEATITHKVHLAEGETEVSLCMYIADHEIGMIEIGKLLTEPEFGVISDPDEIEVVGHRIVHGGEKLTAPAIVTPAVKQEIKKLFPMAPLHNPGHYQGIEVAQKMFTKAVHIVVFDTAFHQTMPEKAFRYAIAESFYTDHAIRVYGFHGISHQYVAEQALTYLGKPDAKIITIHLGNGCSMAAVNAGKCVDTSMGLTPLDGLIMGTRSGSIDPSVITYLITQAGYTGEEIDTMLNKQSGMKGLAGSNDMRDIKKLMDEGDTNAKLAYDMYAYRIKKYIGSYAAVLNGLDAIVFTAGVGENSSLVREMVCRDMEFLGIRMDADKNDVRSTAIREINTENSTTKVLIIPTNEELEIANQCVALLGEVALKTEY